jgi:hypothetical protein
MLLQCAVLTVTTYNGETYRYSLLPGNDKLDSAQNRRLPAIDELIPIFSDYYSAEIQ